MATERDATAALDQLRAAVARVESREVPERPAPGPTRRRRSRTPEAPPSQPGERESDPYDVARAIVLRQLTMAPKTRAQLRDVLARRDCPDDVAEAVLNRMEEVGLVDDAAYARLLIESRQHGRGLARRALSHELHTKGVDKATAAEALDEVDPSAERRRARELVDDRLPRLHGLETSVQVRRLASMLERKGYPGDMAYAVIRDALADSPEHQRD